MKDIHSDGTKKTLDGFIVPEGTPDYNNTDFLNRQIDNVFNQSSSYEKQDRFWMIVVILVR